MARSSHSCGSVPCGPVAAAGPIRPRREPLGRPAPGHQTLPSLADWSWQSMSPGIDHFPCLQEIHSVKDKPFYCQCSVGTRFEPYGHGDDDDDNDGDDDDTHNGQISTATEPYWELLSSPIVGRRSRRRGRRGRKEGRKAGRRSEKEIKQSNIRHLCALRC